LDFHFTASISLQLLGHLFELRCRFTPFSGGYWLRNVTKLHLIYFWESSGHAKSHFGKMTPLPQPEPSQATSKAAHDDKPKQRTKKRARRHTSRLALWWHNDNMPFDMDGVILKPGEARLSEARKPGWRSAPG
jgi:hypothetical protein